MAARFVRDEEAGSSNLPTPTIQTAGQPLAGGLRFASVTVSLAQYRGKQAALLTAIPDSVVEIAALPPEGPQPEPAVPQPGEPMLQRRTTLSRSALLLSLGFEKEFECNLAESGPFFVKASPGCLIVVEQRLKII